MSIGLRIKLSLMMFLQYAVWSIWALALVPHLTALKISEFNIGLILACGGLGSLLGPLVLGALADRYFATEKVLAFCHVVGGALLIAAGYQQSFTPLFVLMLLYCTLYFPTVGLTTALTFRALGEEGAGQFARIRMWGSIGWLAATWLTGRYLASGGVEALKPLHDLVGAPALRDVLRIPGLISIVLGLYCLLLPHTPPVKQVAGTPNKSALAESWGLLADRSFAVLVFVSALFGMLLYYYFQCEGGFLPSRGSTPSNVGSQMAIGQVAEIIAMALVPAAVAGLGIKRTMLLGGLAYTGLFAINAVGQPWELMVAANLLHGFTFGFFFVVAQMFVDKASSADIKASAQSLFVFIVFGLANVIGNIGAGAIRDALLPDWRAVWAVPLVVSLVALAIFALLFREDRVIAVKKADSGSPLEV
jgi:nucleoside transporter